MKSNELMAEYIAAFKAANKMSEPPDMYYGGGWYTLKSPRSVPKRYRRAAIEQMRDTLLTRARIERDGHTE